MEFSISVDDLVPDPVIHHPGHDPIHDPDVKLIQDDHPIVSFSHALCALSESNPDDDQMTKIELSDCPNPDSSANAFKWKLPEPRQLLISLFQPDSQIDLCLIEDLTLTASSRPIVVSEVPDSGESSVVIFGPWTGSLTKQHAEAVLSCNKWVMCLIGVDGEIALFADVSLGSIRDTNWKSEDACVTFELRHHGSTVTHQLRQLDHAAKLLNQSLGQIDDNSQPEPSSHSKESGVEEGNGSTGMSSGVEGVEIESEDEESKKRIEEVIEIELKSEESKKREETNKNESDDEEPERDEIGGSDEEWLPGEDDEISEDDERDAIDKTPTKADCDSSYQTVQPPESCVTTKDNTRSHIFNSNENYWTKSVKIQTFLNALVEKNVDKNVVGTANGGKQDFLGVREESVENIQQNEVFLTGTDHNKQISTDGRTKLSMQPYETITENLKSFQSSVDLTRFWRKFSCLICNISYRQKLLLKTHICKSHLTEPVAWREISKAGIETFHCWQCNKSFGCRKDLDEHVKSGVQDETMECNVCKAKYYSLCRLKIHLQHHIDTAESTESAVGERNLIKEFFCIECQMSLDSKIDINRHSCQYHRVKAVTWKEISATGIESFHCSLCDSQFESKSDLDEHSKLHDVSKGNKSNVCEVCGKHFPSLLCLKKHSIIHNPNKKCHLCSYRTTTNSKLQIHLNRRHFGNKPFGCEICGKKYFEKKELMCHFKKHHIEENYNCDVCGENFKIADELKKHKCDAHGIEQMNNREPFGCEICGKKYFEKKELMCHFKKHHIEENYNCDVCGENFKIADELKKHKCDAHGIEATQMEGNNSNVSEQDLKEHKAKTVHSTIANCNACGKNFQSQTALKRHTKSHRREWPYICLAIKCLKQFKEKHELEGHRTTCPHMVTCDVCGKRSTTTRINSHIKEMHNKERKLYECDICEKKYVAENSLKIHRINVHGGEKPYICDVCGKSYAAKSALNAHKKVHDSPVKCHLCNFKTTGNYRLQVHLKRHSGEMPFCCDICGKRFVRRMHLNRHQKSHRGEPRYHKCVTCGEKFKTSYQLKKHKRDSHGIKPKLKCTYCGRDFLNAVNLAVHLNTHTGEKPFKCEVCEKAFTQPTAKSRHMRIHTGEQAYSCNICGMKFNQSCSVTRHMKTQHKK